jgi:hypothetical protein
LLSSLVAELVVAALRSFGNVSWIAFVSDASEELFVTPRVKACCACRLAQAAVVACQLVVHARRVADMGFLSPEAFQGVVTAQRMALPYLPPIGADTIWLRGAYQVCLKP